MLNLYQIEEMLFLSKKTIKNRIKLLGIVPVKIGKYNQFFYDIEQVQLIKENNQEYYEKYFIYESKINYQNINLV